jgi:hypothetical protein
MGEPITYTIYCDCTGQRRDFVYLVDQRPAGDTGFTVDVPSAGDMQHLLAGVDYLEASSHWAKRPVTVTLWADTHASITIRCPGCQKQQQMSADTATDLIDHLAAAKFREIPFGVLSKWLSHRNG